MSAANEQVMSSGRSLGTTRAETAVRPVHGAVLTEFFVAVALLSDHFVALALVVLAPITINVMLFHAVLVPGGIAAGIILMALHLTMAWFKRDSYRELLHSK